MNTHYYRYAFSTLSIFISLFLGFCSFNLHAQGQQNARIVIDESSGPNPWNHLKVYNDAETFQFAIVTDRTGGNRPGIFPTAINKLNLLMPEFVMSVGDLIQGYTEDLDELNRQWDQFDGFIDGLKVPFFYVPGNHDITNKTMADLWQERLGNAYYHFIYKDVLFLCLNSEEAYQGAGRGGIEEEQFEWIKKTLEEHDEVKWTLVFMHQPLWTQENPRMWPQVEELLKDRKHNVFVGHNHNYVKYERNNGKYFVLATTGGGSRLRGPMFGEFDHVVWVTMTEDGPLIANLMLDGIWDENVRTEELAAMLSDITVQPAATVEPVLNEDLEENQLPVYSIRLQNRSNGLMDYSLTIKNGTDSLLQGQIQPNSTIIQEVGATHLEQTVDIDLLFSYKLEPYPQLDLKQQLKLAPISFNELSETKEKIDFDGVLNEWGDLRYEASELKSAPFHHDGNEDGHLSWDLRIVDSTLYVAIKVLDDDLYTPSSSGHLEQDAVAFLLDPGPLTYSAQNIADREMVFKSWFPAMVTPHEERVDKLAYQSILGESFKVVCVRNTEGYTAEYSLPLRALQLKGGMNDQTFRINLFLNDFDHNGEHQTNISWQPSWDSPQNIFGSGTFRIN